MPDNIEVSTTPIQRNLLDVATELTQLYFSAHPIGDVDEIQRKFFKFYAIAAKARSIDGATINANIPNVL
jgi:hypothetical protein